MRGSLLTLALVFGPSALASASQIAVGLDWRQNVFVQEFWQNGKPRYAIYNGRPEAIKLTVNDVRFGSVPGTEGFQAIEGKDLASWEVKGKGVVFVDAPALPAGNGLQFLRFRIADGPAAGRAHLPGRPRGPAARARSSAATGSTARAAGSGRFATSRMRSPSSRTG